MKKTKPHFSRSRLNQAIALALLTAAASPAMAGYGSCSNGSNTISGAETDTCYLESGDSLNVTGSGSITVGSDHGIYVYGANSITNSGVVTSDYSTLYLYGATVNGNVTNSGTLESTGYHGVYVYGSSSITGNFTNSGTMTASSQGIYVYGIGDGAGTGGLDIGGNFTNSGLIDAGGSGIYVYGSTLSIAGDFVNSGTIDAGGSGIYVYAGADGSFSVAGDVINSGLIDAGDYGMYLYGANIGGDLVNSGTIAAAGAGIYLYGSVQGKIENSGTITSGDSGLYIMNTGAAAESITNSGTITADDKGLVYSGSVTGNVTNTGLIDSGDAGLYIFGGGLVGGNIVNSGTIDADDMGVYIYSDVVGNIENSGTIISGDAGIYIFNSSNVGGSIINSGTIESGGYGLYVYADVGGNVENSGLIDSGYSGMYIYKSNITGSVVNSGTIDAGGMGLYLYGSTFGGINNSGTIQANDWYGVYLYGSSVSGDIVNSGTIDSGGAYPSIYVYNSTVTGEINNSGTLLGHIEINDGDVVNSGLIHTMDEQSYVEDDFSNTSGGTLRFNVDSAAVFGDFDFDDTATFAAGSTLSVDAQTGNTLADGNVLNNVVTAGTLSATTFNVTDNSLAFQFTPVIDGNTVDLNVTGTGMTDVSTAIGGTIGTVLDTIIANDPDGEVAFTLGSASTVGELSAIINATLAPMSGGVAQSSLDFVTAFDNIVGSRQFGIASGDPTFKNKNFWLKGYGSFADQDERDSVAGYEVDSYGVAVGVDGEASPTWTVGAAFTYLNSDLDGKVNVGSHKIDVDTIFGKVYATHRLDSDTVVNLQAGIGFSDYDSRRRVVTGDVASADYDSKHFRASAEWVRTYQRSENSSVSPYVRAEYRYADVDSYHETGAGGLNLDVDDSSADAFILGVGARGEYTTSNNWVLTGNAGIGYDFATDDSSVDVSYQGFATEFSTGGMEPSKVVYNLGLGAKYQLNNGTEIRAGYDLNGRKDFTDQSLSVKARWKF